MIENIIEYLGEQIETILLGIAVFVSGKLNKTKTAEECKKAKEQKIAKLKKKRESYLTKVENCIKEINEMEKEENAGSM